jgi:hypothetical protein
VSLTRDQFAGLVDTACLHAELEARTLSERLSQLKVWASIVGRAEGHELQIALDEYGHSLAEIGEAVTHALGLQARVQQLRAKLADLVARHYPTE